MAAKVHREGSKARKPRRPKHHCFSSPAAPTGVTLTFDERHVKHEVDWLGRVKWTRVTEDVNGKPLTPEEYEVQLRATDASGVPVEVDGADHDFWRQRVPDEDDALARAVFSPLPRPKTYYYQARVRVLNRIHGGSCWSAWSGWTTAAQPSSGALAGPSAPTGLQLTFDRVEGAKGNPWRAKARWNTSTAWTPTGGDPVDVEGYDLQLGVAKDSGGVTVLNIRRGFRVPHEDGETYTRHDFLNIRGRRFYQTRVRAHALGRAGAWSSWTAWDSPAGAPAAPTGVACEERTPRDVLVTWTAPTDLTDVDGYFVRIIRQGGAGTVVEEAYVGGALSTRYRWAVPKSEAEANPGANYRARVFSVEQAYSDAIDDDALSEGDADTEEMSASYTESTDTALSETWETAATPDTDGAAPASSPTPTVIPGLGVLHVRWDGVVNDDPVTYEVHVSTTSGFTPGASTLVAETDATAFTLKSDADDAALVYDTLYFVALIAKDADGSAAAGTQASGTPSQVTGGDLVAGTITADKLDALLTLSSKIQTASSGRRVEIDADGLRLLDSNEAPVVDLPTDSDEDATFTGSVVASELTVESSSTFRNTGTFDLGSTFLLASSLADPTVSPTVSTGLESLTFGDTAGMRGLWHDGTDWWGVTGDYGEAQVLRKVNGTTYAAISGTTLSLPVGSWYVSTVVKVGAYWYGLGLSSGAVKWLVWSDSAGVPGTRTASTTMSDWTGYYMPAVTTDGTSLYVAQSNRTPTGGNLKAWLGTFTAPGTGSAPGAAASSVTSDTFNASSDCLSVYYGSGDFGATRWVVKWWNQEDALVYNTTGVEQTSEDWELASASFTAASLGYDGSEWLQSWGTEAKAYRFTAIDATAAAASAVYYWAYSWYDNDATGGTHESGLSPRTSALLKKRRRFVVSWPAIPDNGGTDDPNTVQLYALKAASDPGTAHASYNDQGSPTAGTSTTVTTYGTTAGTAGTAFAAGTAASLETESAGMKLKGDGTFVMPTFTSVARPTSPETGRMYFDTTVGAFYVYNGSVWIPFGGYLGAQVPKNADQSVSNTINANEVITFAGSTFDTGVTNGAGTNTPYFVNADDAFTVPTGAAGMYEVLAVVEWAVPTGNCDARVKIWKNGSVAAGVVSGGGGAIAQKDARLLSAGQQVAIVVPFTVELAAGDSLRVAVGHNDSASLSVKGDGTTKNTYFELTYLGPKHA